MKTTATRLHLPRCAASVNLIFHYTCLRRWTHLLLAFGALAGTLTAAVPPITPWAVLKCKFSDQNQEPVFDPLLFTSAYGMAGYWLGVSHGKTRIEGTTVFPENGGWYTLPITEAEGRAMTRLQRIDACIAAANDVDFSRFYSVIAILNVPVDSGSAGGKVLLDPMAWNSSFAAHEMGHCYGLDHSFDDSGIVYDPSSDNRPGAYGNGWDIMSAMNFGKSTNTTFVGQFGTSGPGINATTMDKLGWMDANRILTWDATSRNVVLAALNRRDAIGHFMVRLPLDSANPSRCYTVEFRRKIDWDQGIPRDTVLIHETRADGLTYLIRANGGPERLPEQTFRDVGNNVAITVLSMDASSSTAEINIGRNEVWTDFNYQGAIKSGTFDSPYDTLAGGLTSVAYNGTLHLKAGARNEAATIRRKMTIQAYGGQVTIGR